MTSGPFTTIEPAATHRHRHHVVDSGDLLMWPLIALTALSPLPLGSNRPLAWTAMAIVVGALVVAAAVLKWRRAETFAFPLRSIALPTALYAGVLLFLVVQSLPIGDFIALGGVGRDDWIAPLRTLSLAPGATLLTLLQMGTYGLFFWLMLEVGASQTRRDLCLNLILWVIVAYAAIGIISLRLGDTILGMEKWAYQGSATATFVNRNSFATFVAFGAVIAVAQFAGTLHARMERRQRSASGPGSPAMLFVYGLAIMVLLSAVVASNSRMGAFVTAGGIMTVLVIYLLRPLAKNRRRSRMLPVAALMAVAVAGIAALYGGELLDRIGSLDRSSEQRADLYAQVVDLIARHPWTGIGGGAFELAFPLVHAEPVSIGVVWDKAHNTYLALWAELGIIFGSIPIILLGAMAVLLVANIRQFSGSLRAQIVALGVIAVGGLHSLADFSLEIQANTLCFLALVALGVAPALRSWRTARTADEADRPLVRRVATGSYGH